MIILLDGKEYAVGLNWFAVTSLDEVEQFKREMDMSFGLLRISKKEGESSSVALAGPEYADQVSIAGILSRAYPNLIFITKTNIKTETGPQYYLCAVKNGVVTVEGDTLADLDTIISLYQQTLVEMTGDTPIEAIERFGCEVDEAVFTDLNPVKIDDVLEPAQKYASQCTIKPLVQKKLSLPSMVAVASVFMIGCYVLYAWLTPPPPPPPAPKVVHHVAAPPKRDLLQEFWAKFLPTLKTAPRADVIADVVAKVKAAPVMIEGWEIDGLAYEPQMINNVIVSLRRTPYTTANNLKDVINNQPLVDFSLGADMNTATAALVGELMIKDIDPNLIKGLTSGGVDAYTNFASLMQGHNLSYSTKIDPAIKYFVANNFVIQGKDLWALERVGGLLKTIPTLGVRQVVIRYNAGVYDWVIQGTVYG